jgi:hypothetical protein
MRIMHTLTCVGSDGPRQNEYIKMAPNANRLYGTYVESCNKYKLKVGLVPLPVFLPFEMNCNVCSRSDCLF